MYAVFLYICFMAYSKENKEAVLNDIFDKISKGASLRSSLKIHGLSSQTFDKWIDESEEKTKQYARAKDKRTDTIFEDILNIADENNGDVYYDENDIERTNHDVIARAKLRIDSRKWMLGKMNAKRYGDKIQTEHSGEITTNVISLGNGINPDEANT